MKGLLLAIPIFHALFCLSHTFTYKNHNVTKPFYEENNIQNKIIAYF